MAWSKPKRSTPAALNLFAKDPGVLLCQSARGDGHHAHDRAGSHILCDMTDRAEVLHFITAVNARAIMVRPLWVAFELVGTPLEIEGVYQSALAYGIVDLVSSSCAIEHLRMTLA